MGGIHLTHRAPRGWLPLRGGAARPLRPGGEAPADAFLAASPGGGGRDNYLASRGRMERRPFVVPFPPRWMAERLFPPHLRPADEDNPRRWRPEWRRICYAFGVGEADLAVAALERMLRG